MFSNITAYCTAEEATRVVAKHTKEKKKSESEEFLKKKISLCARVILIRKRNQQHSVAFEVQSRYGSRKNKVQFAHTATVTTAGTQGEEAPRWCEI